MTALTIMPRNRALSTRAPGRRWHGFSIIVGHVVLVLIVSYNFSLLSARAECTPARFRRGIVSSINAVNNPLDSLSVADLDRDGDNDIVAGGVVLLNDGSGSYWPSGQLPSFNVSFPVQSSVLADFDSDGWIDAAGAGGPIAAWYRSQSSGSVFQHEMLPTPASTTVAAMLMMLATDVHQDGLVDLIVNIHTIDGYSFLWLYTNDGNVSPRFTATKIDVVPHGVVRSVHHVDLDGDGKKDLLVNAFQSVCTWYRNLEHGQFEYGGQVPNGDPGFFSHVNIGDFDEDGNVDVATAGESGISWYPNLGNGTFTSGRLISNSAGATQVNAFGVADIDGDGVDDVISANDLGDTLVWYRNQGDGHFASAAAISASTNGVSGLIVGDITADAVADIITLVSTSLQVQVFQQNPRPPVASTSFRSQSVLSTPGGSKSMAVADFDRDGDEDIISGSVLMMNDGSSGNWPSIELASLLVPGVSYQVSSIVLADFDNDGWIDVAATGGPLIAWYQNQNSGTTFQQHMMTRPDPDFSDIIEVRMAADLNGDGLIDIIISLRNPATQTYTLWRYTNAGNVSPRFTATEISAIPPSPSITAVLGNVDLDGDGAEDLVVASGISGGSCIWYRSLGDGHFLFGGQLLPISPQPNGAFFDLVDLGDFDNDGKVDVVASNERGIFWWQNSGFGIFLAGQVIDDVAAAPVYALRVADIDGDGVDDIVSANAIGNKLTWYRSIGAGRFATATVIDSSAIAVVGLAFADVSNIGQVDVVSFSATSFRVQLYTRFVVSTFDPYLVAAFDGGAYRNGSVLNDNLLAGDLSGDGCLDVAATTDSRQLIWVRNTGASFNEPVQVIDTLDTPGDFIELVALADMDADSNLDIVCILRQFVIGLSLIHI